MSEFRAGKFEREKVPGWARGFCPAHSSLSLLDIDLKSLAQSGKKLILLDVDNTLLPWKGEAIPQTSLDWITTARKCGLELCILSNTRHPARLDRIAKKLGVNYLQGRFKPSTAMYRQALKQFGAQPQQAVMIGDQLFTDILGANRAGIEAIWVRPMSAHDFVGTKISRFGERLVRGTLFRNLQDGETAEAVDLPPGGAGAMELLKKPVVRQFVKFCIIGGLSFAIDVGIHGVLMYAVKVGDQQLGVVFGNWLIEKMPFLFAFASDATGASYPVLKIPTAGLAILNSFYWNRRWTFNIRGREERLAQLHKFVVVALIGMALNTVIGTALKNVIPGHSLRSWGVASVIAAVVVAFWNFSGQKLWTFRKKHS